MYVLFFKYIYFGFIICKEFQVDGVVNYYVLIFNGCVFDYLFYKNNVKIQVCVVCRVFEEYLNQFLVFFEFEYEI